MRPTRDLNGGRKKTKAKKKVKFSKAGSRLTQDKLRDKYANVRPDRDEKRRYKKLYGKAYAPDSTTTTKNRSSAKLNSAKSRRESQLATKLLKMRTTSKAKIAKAHENRKKREKSRNFSGNDTLARKKQADREKSGKYKKGKIDKITKQRDQRQRQAKVHQKKMRRIQETLDFVEGQGKEEKKKKRAEKTRVQSLLEKYDVNQPNTDQTKVPFDKKSKRERHKALIALSKKRA
jgi:hypothetical protein